MEEKLTIELCAICMEHIVAINAQGGEWRICPKCTQLSKTGVAFVEIDPALSMVQPDGEIDKAIAHRTGRVIWVSRVASNLILKNPLPEGIPFALIHPKVFNLLRKLNPKMDKIAGLFKRS
jgi:hypothetical protein